MKKIIGKLRNYGLAVLATTSFIGFTSAQFSCGSGVLLTDGYTATGITTPGTGGIEDWVSSVTGPSSTSYWNDDVYLFEYTAGATAEDISMTIDSRNSWNGIGIFTTCSGSDLSGSLDDATSSSSGPKTVSASISAGQTVYIAVGQYGAPNDLDFDVTDFSVVSITCPITSSLATSSISTTSVDLAWTETGSASSWIVEYGPAGFATGSGTMIQTSSNPYTLSSLSVATDYDVYVRAFCAVGDTSEYGLSTSFSTLCNVFVPNYSTDFSSFLPNCWDEADAGTVITGPQSLGSGSWSQNSTAARINMYSNSKSDWLVTPEFDLSMGGYEIVFTASAEDYTFGTPTAFSGMGSDDSVQVVVSTDNGLTWSTVYTFDVNNEPGFGSNDYTISLSTYTGASNIFGIIASEGSVDDSEDYYFSVENFEIRTAPSCAEPSLLSASNITATSADLSWTENGTATAWNVEWGTAGFTPGSGTTETGVTNPFVLTGLTATIDYDFYVQADCGGSTSSFSSLGSFTTACATFTAPFYEGFNNAVQPACWENLSSDPGTGMNNFWNFNKQGENGALLNGKAIGTFVSSDGSTPNPDSMMLYTPWIDLSGLTDPELRFEWFSNNTNAPANNVPLIINIYDGSTWTNLDTLKGNYPAWSEVYYDLSAYANSTIKVLFMTNQAGVVSAFQNDILLDEVSIDEMVTCNKPTLLAAANISSTSADISWTGTAAEYEVEYGALGFTIGTGTSSIETTNSLNVTGLTPDTDYDFYVRAICAVGDSSVWTPVLSMTTLCMPYSIPYFEGFETGYTQNISVTGCVLQESENGTQEWSANNTETTYNRAPRTGNWNAFLRYGNTDWMFIPVDLVGGTSYTMEVYARQDGSTVTNADITLSYGTSGDAAAMTNSIVAATGLVDGTYQLIDGEFTPTTTGVYYIGIKGFINSSPWYISVDDISIYETPPCADPSALSVANLTTTSADLAWTENGTATTWNIEYGPTGFTQGTGTAMQGVTANPYTLTGLMPCMNYEYYVQADCGGGDLSAFVGPFAFTTLAAPATGTDTQVACDTYTWIDGNTYTASNTTATYTIVGGGSSVCGNDSIVTLDLTINTAVTGTDVQVACETYTWIDGNDYTANNNTATYTVVGGAANGCDSIVTLDLTIEQGSDAGSDNAKTYCLNEPVDLSTLLSAGADAGGTWYGPGNSPLTSSNITVSNQGGTYVYKYVTSTGGACPADTALITITADAGCDYLSVDTEMLVDISVYPNPATSILTILNPSNTSSLKVEMLDMNGRVVLVENQALNNATQATLAIENLERGIYTLRIYNNEGQKTFKIVKQ